MPFEAAAHHIGRFRHVAGATIFLIAVYGASTPLAQAPAPVTTVASVKAEPTSVEAAPRTVQLFVGRSTVVNTGAAISRVSLTSAEIADALITGPAQLLVHGKVPGIISMFVWYRSGEIRRYEITVLRDIAMLHDEVARLFPGESIAVEANGKDVVLSGKVSTKDIADRAVNLAAGFVAKKEDVVTLLQIQPAQSNQVLLRVRFAEVSRSALTQLGSSFFTGPGGYEGKGNMGQTGTQQYPAPAYDDFLKRNANVPPGDAPDRQTFSDFLNLFFFSNKYNVGTVIKALSQRGLFQSLAEPNLVAESGKEASFLAGGEIPVPIAQGSATGIAITVQYKEFGIRLSFTPVVTGDRIRLKLRPEVSSLDFTNGIVLQGFRIPALTTRRTETEIELANGQTFAVAGLLNNSMSSTLRKIPGIGDIPVLGLLFQSKAAQKEQTELVIMITPEILPLGSPGVTPNLPRQQEPYLAPMPENRSVEPPPPPFRGPGRAGEPVPAASAEPPAGAVAAVPSRQLTKEERKLAEQARKQEHERLKQERAQAEAEQKHQEELAREQAKRDAETAKREAEQRKKDLEAEKQRQKVVAEAEAKLKAAQAAYEAEIAKKNRKDQQAEGRTRRPKCLKLSGGFVVMTAACRWCSSASR